MSELSKAPALIQVIDGLVSTELHAEAAAHCSGKTWYFGNRSNHEHDIPFWKMDLNGVAAFDAIWEVAKPRCEELTGLRLQVSRRYANGHTYGLGGSSHRDDERPGTFTLLYYPALEWKLEWQGETIFLGEGGEITRAVMPKPNRAVLFAAHIPHAGRAPSRSCPELRVTVAYKLEPEMANAHLVGPIPAPREPIAVNEVSRQGAERVYQLQAAAECLSEQTAHSLLKLGESLRLPGFRAGKIPFPVLQSRYGERTRGEIIARTANEAALRLLAEGSIPGAMRLVCGNESGDLEVEIRVTYLPDLPEPSPGSWTLERLTASKDAWHEAGLAGEDPADLLAEHLRQQVLDRLDAIYDFPIADALIEREFAAIWKPAEFHGESAEFRKIAERRVRLGAVVAELARRYGIVSGIGTGGMESEVVSRLLSLAQIADRDASSDELLELFG